MPLPAPRVWRAFRGDPESDHEGDVHKLEEPEADAAEDDEADDELTSADITEGRIPHEHLLGIGRRRAPSVARGYGRYKVQREAETRLREPLSPFFYDLWESSVNPVEYHRKVTAELETQDDLAGRPAEKLRLQEDGWIGWADPRDSPALPVVGNTVDISRDLQLLTTASPVNPEEEWTDPPSYDCRLDKHGYQVPRVHIPYLSIFNPIRQVSMSRCEGAFILGLPEKEDPEVLATLYDSLEIYGQPALPDDKHADLSVIRVKMSTMTPLLSRPRYGDDWQYDDEEERARALLEQLSLARSTGVEPGKRLTALPVLRRKIAVHAPLSPTISMSTLADSAHTSSYASAFSSLHLQRQISSDTSAYTTDSLVPPEKRQSYQLNSSNAHEEVNTTWEDSPPEDERNDSNGWLEVWAKHIHEQQLRDSASPASREAKLDEQASPSTVTNPGESTHPPHVHESGDSSSDGFQPPPQSSWQSPLSTSSYQPEFYHEGADMRNRDYANLHELYKPVAHRIAPHPSLRQDHSRVPPPSVSKSVSPARNFTSHVEAGKGLASIESLRQQNVNLREFSSLVVDNARNPWLLAEKPLLKQGMLNNLGKPSVSEHHESWVVPGLPKKDKGKGKERAVSEDRRQSGSFPFEDISTTEQVSALIDKRTASGVPVLLSPAYPPTEVSESDQEERIIDLYALDVPEQDDTTLYCQPCDETFGSHAAYQAHCTENLLHSYRASSSAPVRTTESTISPPSIESKGKAREPDSPTSDSSGPPPLIRPSSPEERPSVRQMQPEPIMQGSSFCAKCRRHFRNQWATFIHYRDSPHHPFFCRICSTDWPSFSALHTHHAEKPSCRPPEMEFGIPSFLQILADHQISTPETGRRRLSRQNRIESKDPAALHARSITGWSASASQNSLATGPMQLPSPQTTASRKNHEPPACPICMGRLMQKKEVLATACGHVYCSTCILHYMQTQKRECPKCRTPLATTLLVPLHLHAARP